MTSKESAQDKELLQRYRRASDTEAAAPSEAVRAAILAEGRRAAELRAKQARGQPFDASRPAANDSRWKITAFGTAGAALVAALLFAPRLWESAPPAASVSNTAQPPKLESQQASHNASEPLQEIVVTQARESSKAADAASPIAARISAPKATAVQPKTDLPAPPARQEALARSAAPEEKIYPQNYAPAAPPERQRTEALAQSVAPKLEEIHTNTNAAPPAAPIAPAPQIASLGASQNAAHAVSPRSAPQPSAPQSAAPQPAALQSAALQSAAASGDTALTTVLLNQGAALDARDEHGRTPLMLAVMQGRLDVVRLLLNRGADPNIADSAGRTPLQQAKQDNLREIAALLQGAGAR